MRNAGRKTKRHAKSRSSTNLNIQVWFRTGFKVRQTHLKHYFHFCGEKLYAKRLAFCNDAFIYNTSPNCTNCEAPVDHTLGRELKNGIRDIFWGDFKSSPKRIEWYCKHDVREVDWRILLTFWTWQSWEKLSVLSSLILTCAKQVGFANCSCGWGPNIRGLNRWANPNDGHGNKIRKKLQRMKDRRKQRRSNTE